MTDAMQNAFKIAKMKLQVVEAIKNDKTIKTQLVRQPSNNQIRITKTNRQSNYDPTRSKLLPPKVEALKQLTTDTISNPSNLIMSTKLCQDDTKIIDNVIYSTQPILMTKQNDLEINQTLVQCLETQKEQKNSINNNLPLVQDQLLSTLKNDETEPINQLFITSRHISFGDMAVLSFNQKKAENNKITHKMYMMQNLNKFKRDKLIPELTESEQIVESASLQVDKPLIVKHSEVAQRLHPCHLQQDMFQNQTTNQLSLKQNLFQLLQDEQQQQDVPIQPKKIALRVPLMQEQLQINEQSLCFSTNTLQQIKEVFVKSFPCKILRFSMVKQDSHSNETQCLTISQSTLVFQEKPNQINIIPTSQKCSFAQLKRDSPPYIQPFIVISDKILKLETQNILDQVITRKEPLFKSNKIIRLSSDFQNKPNIIKKINQNPLDEIKFQLTSQFCIPAQKLIFERMLNFKQDSVSIFNQQTSEFRPCSFPNQIQQQSNDKVCPKEIPQYPSLIEMNRMKIEKIKKLIAGGTPNKSMKQRRGSQNPIEDYTEDFIDEKKGLRVDNLVISKPLFQSAKGSMNLDERSPSVKEEDKCEAQTENKKRSTSIDKLPQLMQMSKNQSSVLNRFKKIKYLGRGQMSDVYSVLDTKTGMVLALKTIQKSLINSKGLGNLILNEIKIQMLINHQNILKCFGVINDNKQIALVLEKSDQTLYNYIHQLNMTKMQMIDVLFQVLSAVDYLHNFGIIHRDIKPENILMCNKVIKLADLGISIRAKHCMQYCGTPGYMAPEVRHHKIYTNKIDCYSIGVLIYEMIHKKLPNQTIYPIKNPQRDPLIELMNNLVEPEENLRYSCSQALENDLFKDKQNATMYCLEKDIKKLLTDWV